MGQGKSDVYLANRALGKAVKTSFHESGYRQNAFIEYFLRKEGVDEDKILDGRLIDKWHQPVELGKGITLEYRVVIPCSAVTIPMVKGGFPKIQWIPAPAVRQAIEIAIIFTEPETLVTGWPARRSMGTELVGKLELENGSTVWLVYHQVEIPQFGPVQGKVTPFQSGKDVDLSQSDIGIIVLGTAQDGSRFMMECATEFSESALKTLKQP